MVELRDYQREAIAATAGAWARRVRRPAIVLPTGAGKTTVFSSIEGALAEQDVVSLTLAHRDELLAQAAERAREMNPGLRVGIVGMGREEIRGRQIIVGSVPALGRNNPGGRARLDRLLRAMGPRRLVVVDECHHAVADSYMRVLRHLGCFDPIPEDGALTGAYALGVTATMTRSDRLALGQVWEEVAYKVPIIKMIREGYLVNARGMRVKVAGLDLTRVKRTAGDFNQGELSEALHDADAPKAIVRAYLERAENRKAIVFAPGVAIGYEIAQAFRDEGVSAIALDGNTDKIRERPRIVAAFKRGEYRVVVNCGLFTEGFDEPTIDCVIIARPTSSGGLYVQMAGRGLRPIEGCVCHKGLPCSSFGAHKRDCLIIDVVGVTGKHRLAGLIDLGGAERTEELDDDLAEYDRLVENDEDIDLLGLLDPSPAQRAARAVPAVPDGPLVVETVDLFYESRMSWLQTYRGVWFLEGGHDRIVFLIPGSVPNTYSVAYTGLRNPSGAVLHPDLTLGEAKRMGEHEAMEETGAGWRTRRSAGWRRGEPSKTQLGEAVRLGINAWGEAGQQEWSDEQPTMTRGEVSDAISIVKVSRRVDDMRAVAGVSVDGYWPASAQLSVVGQGDDDIARAVALSEMARQMDLTHQELSERVGMSRSQVTNLLRLLTLAPEVQQMISSGALSAGHGRAMVPLVHAQQCVIAAAVVNGSVSVRETERMVSAVVDRGEGV